MVKWSPLLHWIAFVSGILGVLSLISAWIATPTGAFMGFTVQHWFFDTISLLLISVAFGIGALIHMNLEKKR